MKIIILSEDASTGSAEVLTNIVQKAIRQITPQIEISEIDFDKSRNELEVISSNRWKANKEPHNSDIRAFMQRILNELIDDDTFVFWHVDGDIAWSARGSDGGENYRKFNQIIKGTSTFRSPMTGRDIEIDISKVFLTMPYYSMESWLLPFVDQLTPSSNKIQKRREEEIMAIPLEEFDEIEKIKHVHNINENLTLSKEFKHDRLYTIGKSYTKFFDSVIGNASFVAELKEQLPPWARY